MARSEARLVVSIWEDPDFLSLTPSAQRLFMFLISQPDLAHDGVIALRERRWSKKAAGLTVAQIGADLDELSAARFTLVDEDAEELLVRSFIRRDKVYRQPNVLRAAADHLATVSSPMIRAAIGTELARIQTFAEDIPAGSKDVLAGMLEACGNPSANPSANPPGDGKGSGNPSGAKSPPDESSDTPRDDADESAGDEGSGNPSGNPSGKGSGLRPGERGVVTAVSSDSPIPVPLSPDPVPRDDASRRPRVPARERATRIPDDFAANGVTPEMVAWAREHTPHVNGGYETQKFVDYWHGKSGRDATKTDWPATWRNWMRREQEKVASRQRGPATGANRHTSQRHDNPFAEDSR